MATGVNSEVSSPSRRIGRMALILALTTAAASAAFVLVWVPKETNRAVSATKHDLSIRADLLQFGVEYWVEDGLADAVTVASYHAVREALLSGPGLPGARYPVDILSTFVGTHGFDAAFVIRADGTVPAGAGTSNETGPDNGCIAAARGSIAAQEPRIDIHRHASGELAVAFAAPAFAAGSREPIGAVVFESSPERWLYPVLHAKALQGESAEAVLMTRDGDSALFLTPLKYDQGSVLTVRKALTETPGFSALAALEGTSATGSFADYRGVAVLSATRRISGTPWGLVVKIDEAEVLREVRIGLVKDAAVATSVIVMLGALAFARSARMERRHAAQLARINSRLATVLAQANDAVFFIDRDGRIEEVNRRAERMYGRSHAELVSLPFSALQAEVSGEAAEADREITPSGGGRMFRTRHQRADGTVFPVEISSVVVTIGSTEGIVCVVRDISERVTAEQRIHKLNRLLHTRSETNRLIARTDDMQQVLEGACQLAVADGPFRMAGIGGVEPDGRIRFAASAGSDVDYLRAIEIRWDDTPLGRGPTGTAVRENRTVVFPRLLDDPRYAPWRDKAQAHGFKSSAASPIRRGDAVVAVLNLYAADESTFDNETIAFMEELAADIGFATQAAENRTERARAEAALAQSEHFRRKITESVPNILFLFDLEQRRFSFINGQAGRLLGYDADQLIEDAESTLPRVIHPDDLGQVLENLSRWSNASDGDVLEDEVRARNRSGAWLWFHVQETVFRRDDTGRVVQILGSATDITERRKVETNLTTTEEKLRGFFESDVIGVMVGGIHGKISDANGELLRILGYAPDDFRSGRLNWLDITPPEYLSQRRNAIAEAMERGACTPFEMECIRKDGTRIWGLVGFTLLGEAKEQFAAFLLDISAHRAAEDEIQRLNSELEGRVVERTAQLEAANRELEAFSYSVSHDLRAPLRAIDGFSRIVIEDHARQLDAEGHRLLRVVRASARQMSQLIDDLLELARAGRHEIRKIRMDMTSFVQGAFDEVTAGLAPGAVTLLLGKLPHATCDPGLIRIVWQNLIANAVKFTAPKPERIVEVGAQRENGRTVYHVRDNGVGFDMEYAVKLFGAFQRLHAQGDFEGTGIGLALVQRIVRRHGGDVRAEGAVDKGATFYFSLPDAGSEKGQGE